MNNQLGPSTWGWSLYQGQWGPAIYGYGDGVHGAQGNGRCTSRKWYFDHMRGPDMMDTLATAQQFESATGSDNAAGIGPAGITRVTAPQVQTTGE